MRPFFLDLHNSLKLFPLWRALAWNDVLSRYRRSILGPFWITLSMAITLLAMGPLYGGLFNQSLREFMPHLTLGLVFWYYCSGIINDSSVAFSEAAAIIRQTPLPFPSYILRVTWRQFLIFLHNFCVAPLIFIFCSTPWQLSMLLVFPALVVTTLFCCSLGLIVAILCTRFRDMGPIITSVMTLLFFITPIIWQIELLPENRQWLAQLNPFTHYLELLRSPLLGKIPTYDQWFVASSLALICGYLALCLNRKVSHRIAYWI